MKKYFRSVRSAVLAICAISALSASGCANAPLGPTVQVMPAPGKPFELFQQDQQACRAYAFNAIGGQAAVDQVNQQSLLNGAVATGAGALIGAMAGSAGGHTGAGAQIGAAGGATVGTGLAADNSARGNAQLQQMYDAAYTQCMYAKGDQVANTQQQ
jgi:hypothetical protein